MKKLTRLKLINWHRFSDVTIDFGDSTLISGENGAGKSTTINAILDLIHKDDGTVTFWGQELSSTKQIKEDVGVVFDGINFYETLTPAKVGKIAGAAYKQWDGHLFQDYLKRFQLPADKEIKSLSKGMKMKLCIAVALSHNPKLLILDEATSGLDPVMRDDILDVISTTEELGKPVKSDEKNNKTTYVTIYGLDGASKLVEEYSHTAMTLLDQVCPNASFLKRLFEYLIVRKK